MGTCGAVFGQKFVLHTAFGGPGGMPPLGSAFCVTLAPGTPGAVRSEIGGRGIDSGVCLTFASAAPIETGLFGGGSGGSVRHTAGGNARLSAGGVGARGLAFMADEGVRDETLGLTTAYGLGLMSFGCLSGGPARIGGGVGAFGCFTSGDGVGTGGMLLFVDFLRFRLGVTEVDGGSIGDDLGVFTVFNIFMLGSFGIVHGESLPSRLPAPRFTARKSDIL